MPNQSQRLKQLAQGFLGVNLRKDRVTLADEEMARAINADLHERPGVFQLRRGRRKLFSTPLADLSIRRLALVNGVRYIVAGQSVYRDQTKIIDGLLSSELFTTMQSFRPLNDSNTWVFIADTGLMRKDDGTRTVPWGLEVGTASKVSIGGCAGNLTGDYQSGTSVLRHSGDTVVSESTVVASEEVGGDDDGIVTLSSGVLAISDIVDAEDDHTGVGIYRTVAGGTLFLLDSRERFPSETTTFAVTHGWEVACSPLGVAADGLQLHHSIDKGVYRGTQLWEPEAEAGLRFIDGGAVNAESFTTMPAHQSGDILIIFAHRDNNTSAPPVPSGWSTWGTGSGANGNSSVGGYLIATSSSESSGTWAGATNLVCHVYRGQRTTSPIGGSADNGGSGTGITYPALTMTDTGGTSLVLGFAGHREINTKLETPPTGMVNRTNLVSIAEIAGHDTDSPVTSWPATLVPAGGTIAGWRARTLEIRAASSSSDSTGESEDVSGYHATHLWEIQLGYVTTQTKLWAYASTIADASLGTEGPTDNGTPPLASWVTEFQGHLFLARLPGNEHHLRWSTRFSPESWPADNLLEIGNPDDPIQCALTIAGLLGVFTKNTKYRVTGNATAGFSYAEALSKRGTPAPLACISTEYGIIFPAHEGIFRTNLLSLDEELSAEIAPLFNGETVNDMPAINWSAAQTFAAAVKKGRYYFAYASGEATEPNTLAVLSRTTNKWYFFDHPARSLAIEESPMTTADETLASGFTDGLVYALEDGDSDAGSDIALTGETKDYFGQEPDIRKLFLFGRVDADVPSGATLSVDLYVDGTLKRTASLTGTRSRVLIPFPAGSMGYTWRIRFRYTGQQKVKIYGATTIYVPLESS